MGRELRAQRAPNGANIPLTLAADTTVKFFYDDATHWVTDNRSSVIATARAASRASWAAPTTGTRLSPELAAGPDGDGIGRTTLTELAPGDYEFKVAIDESWDENYGAGGVADGPNIPFTVDDRADTVIISFDQASHVAEAEVLGDRARGRRRPRP